MFLKKHFNLSLVIFTLFFSSASFSSEVAYPMVKVPNRDNEFISIIVKHNDEKNKIIVSLINPVDNSIKKAREINYVNHDRKIVDAFFSEDKGDISLFLLTSNRIDKETGIEGVSYNTFIYDIYEKNIYFNKTPVNVLMNCIDGRNIEKDLVLRCKYKTKEEILNYFYKP